MQKLNKEQIDKLYKFTRQHFVEHYDLQTELVDHMASGIEQLWLQQPELSFEQARDREFKKFGVFGFMDVVEKRQAAMSKKYSKMVWQHFKDYMKIPKILGFGMSIFATFLILKFSSISDALFLGAILGLALLFITSIFLRRKQLKINTDKKENRWMLKDIIMSQGAIGGLAIIPLHLLNIFKGINGVAQMNNLWIVILSLMLCSLYLFLYIMTVEIPKRAEEYLEQTYPEYKMV